MHAGSLHDRGAPQRREHSDRGAIRLRVRHKMWVGLAAFASVLIGPAALAATGWTVQSVASTGNNTLLTAASRARAPTPGRSGSSSARPARPRLRR
jgi:hypothetical protein